MKADNKVFPLSIESENASANEGISNRDYIAIKAMAAIITLAKPNSFEKNNIYRHNDSYLYTELIAEEAYMMADAMIAFSNKGKEDIDPEIGHTEEDLM